MSIRDLILESRGYITLCFSFADLLTRDELLAELTEAKLPKVAVLAAIEEMAAEGLLVPATRRDCIDFTVADDPYSGVYEEREAYAYVPAAPNGADSQPLRPRNHEHGGVLERDR